MKKRKRISYQMKIQKEIGEDLKILNNLTQQSRTLAAEVSKKSVLEVGYGAIEVKVEQLDLACRVVNELGRQEEYNHLFFQAFYGNIPSISEDLVYAIVIAALQQGKASYCSVDECKEAKTWKVIGLPPGAKTKRVIEQGLSSKDEALKIAKIYEKRIRYFPLNVWESGEGISFLPDSPQNPTV